MTELIKYLILKTITCYYDDYNCGTYKISFDLEGADKDNYSVQISAEGIISSKEVTFNFGNSEINYSSENNYELTYAGAQVLVSGDALSNNTIKFTINPNKASADAYKLNSSKITVTTNLSVINAEGKDVTANYIISYVGELTVKALEFSVEFKNTEVTYNAKERLDHVPCCR